MLAVMDEESTRDGQGAVVEGELSAQARCDACGAPMKPMGHCKYWCLVCGFLRTCNDVL